LLLIFDYLDETNQPKIARLALLKEKIETMKKQREMLLNDFRKKIHDDDITKLVLMQRQDNHKVIDLNKFSVLSSFFFNRVYFLNKLKNMKNLLILSNKIVLHKIIFYNY
jgi:hypothetical protein